MIQTIKTMYINLQIPPTRRELNDTFSATLKDKLLYLIDENIGSFYKKFKIIKWSFVFCISFVAPYLLVSLKEHFIAKFPTLGIGQFLGIRTILPHAWATWGYYVYSNIFKIE